MDQLIRASLSHTHYWYGVGMLKVPVTWNITPQVHLRGNAIINARSVMDGVTAIIECYTISNSYTGSILFYFPKCSGTITAVTASYM